MKRRPRGGSMPRGRGDMGSSLGKGPRALMRFSYASNKRKGKTEEQVNRGRLTLNTEAGTYSVSDR